jgi:DNA-binding response OmpR family regulator
MGRAFSCAAQQWAPPRILVTDDSDVARALFRRLLSRRGYIVEEAATGAAALETVDADPPDLLLLDLRLPDIDGSDVLRQLRAERSIDALPTIMISGELDGEVAAACLDMGANDFLMKPVFAALLYARVETCLINRHPHADMQCRLPTPRLANAASDRGMPM